MPFHKDLRDDENHALPVRTYPDIPTRDADASFQIADNIDKEVRVDNPVGYFMLASIGPADWLETSNVGKDQFTELLDTPVSYSGQAGKVVQIDGGEVGVEFGQPLRPTDSPQFTDLTVTGDLFVEGTTTTLDTETLQVEDKNIELGKVTTPSDATADGGGITLLGTTNKVMSWLNSIKAWTFNQIVAIQNELSVGDLSAPATDASIDLKAVDKALLHNRLTTIQRDALAATNGMVVYNTDADDIEFYNGVAWVSMGGGDVVGPAGVVDNALVRFNGVTGKLIQSSNAVLSDQDVFSGLARVDTDEIRAAKSFSVDRFSSESRYEVTAFKVQLPTVVGDRLDIGRVFNDAANAGQTHIIVSTSGSFKSVREYVISHQDGFETGLKLVQPVVKYGGSSTHDYELEIDNVGSRFDVYLRRTAGTASSTVGISIVHSGSNSRFVLDGVTETTVAAPTVTYAGSMISQINEIGDLDHLALGNGSTFVEVNGNRVLPANLVVISKAADMPTTLVDGKYYLLVAPITITSGNEITIPDDASITIASSDRTHNTLSYSGTGTLFTAAELESVSIAFYNVNMFGNVGTSRLFGLLSLGSVASKFPALSLDKCDTRNWGDLGTLAGFGSGIAIGKWGASGNLDGFKIQNSVFFGLENTFIQNFSDTSSNLIDIASDVDRVSISLTGFVAQSNERLINIDDAFTGEVIIVDVFGLAPDRLFDVAGLDQTSIYVKVSNVSNQIDSKTIGSAFVTGNTDVTVIATINTFTDFDLGTAIAGSNIERWSLSDTVTGELTYDGLEPFSGVLIASISGFSAGGAQEFHFRAVKNGVVMADVIETVLEIGSDTSSASLVVPISVVTGDDIRLQVENVDGTANITISHLSMSIQ